MSRQSKRGASPSQSKPSPLFGMVINEWGVIEGRQPLLKQTIPFPMAGDGVFNNDAARAAGWEKITGEKGERFSSLAKMLAEIKDTGN